MIASKLNELLFVEAFVVEWSTAPDAGETLQFSRFGVTSIACVAIVRWTPEHFGLGWNVFYYFTRIVRKFSNKFFAEQTGEMVESIALPLKATFVNCILIFINHGFLVFSFFRSRLVDSLFNVVSQLLTDRALKSVVFIFTVHTFGIVNPDLPPFF